MYAHVLNGAIQSVGPLPSAARRLDTAQWIIPPDRAWTDEQAALCGYFPVSDTPRPEDTPTGTHDRSVELLAGVPTVVWASRDKTQAELDAQAEQDNRSTIEQRAADALDLNRTIAAGADDYLALQSPTNAQVAGQVRALTQSAKAAAQQRNGLIRLLLNQLDGTD